ncbi:MAG TPA: endonuclease/exonuclease/phosphatase family protein [Blastocatellia bacterium]|nr:endonuclease/exonuclease/phosphatase family protein [Blastocatellia bacterium]
MERGTRLNGIIHQLNNHPVMQHADLLLLNELDIGMARSGNVDVSRELSFAISAHSVFAAEYIELTRGTGRERELAADNTTSLHGNAILTRYPFSNPQISKLSRCEDNFVSLERRIGGRIALSLDLEIAGKSVVAATTHLDVVNSPRCRGRQMQSALRAIESRTAQLNGSAGSDQVPVILGGDFNTHTFARGGRLRAMRNTMVVLGGDRQALSRRLQKPEQREPAVRLLSRFGYETAELNDRKPTSRSVVSGLDDSSHLPLPMKWWVDRRLGPNGLLLEFRLDWLAQKGLRVLRAGEVTDAATGVTSLAAHTIPGLESEGQPLSDHDPIVVDVALPSGWF